MGVDGTGREGKSDGWIMELGARSGVEAVMQVTGLTDDEDRRRAGIGGDKRAGRGRGGS